MDSLARPPHIACHTCGMSQQDGSERSRRSLCTTRTNPVRSNRSKARREEPPVLEPLRALPKRRRKRPDAISNAPQHRRHRNFFATLQFPSTITSLLLVLLVFFIPSTSAVFVNFENCLSSATAQDHTEILHFTPKFVWVDFNASSENHNLNITFYGNVSGQLTTGTYPPPDDPSWSNPNSTFGKIVAVSESTNVYTTMDTTVNVLTYTPLFDKKAFCDYVINGSCPIGPSFQANPSNPYELSTFSVAHNFDSSYAFSTFAATTAIISGDSDARTLGCISVSITPDLGHQLTDALRYMPAAILALVAIATVTAATLSPWGTADPFRWTSNYGRDEDLLRLVTPGFGDCLQYIQFVVLSGSLNLAYPGFYQPVVSRASWSILMFQKSFASHGDNYETVQDGVYFVNGTYGLTRMRQYVGMSKDQDVWACMAVFLLALTLCIVILCQLGFLGRWAYRALSNTTEEDLRSKNWPFTGGNIIRIVYNYFLLPIIALSMYQMVVANRSPPSVVAMAVVLLFAVLGFAVWIFWLIFSTRPRAHLFDDLPTVLLYGPLYNTYSDDAAPFAFIPVLLTFMRGVAIGAVQPSGIAQLIILAICEVIMILTLHAFRPFQSNTSMNAYHTFFSVMRLATTLLSVAFVPSLGVTEGPKGWLGYVVLLLHAIVLIFGFFLNALQTLIEVLARLAGAGDARGGLTKAFGMRQLSRRGHRRRQRSSLNSQAAILTQEQDQKQDGARSRSLSASSAVLLNSQGGRMSAVFEQFSQGGDHSVGGASSGPATPGGGAASPFTYLAGTSASGSAGPSSRRPTIGYKAGDAMDPGFYRPPRLRRPTLEAYAPGERSRTSWMSSDPATKPYKDFPDQTEAMELGGAAGFASKRGSISPAYLRTHRDDSDPNLPERNNTDYAVREADFYYGVGRGPALSNLPTRRLKTGPADPMGPVSSATSWFNRFFAGKNKDKGKGFEVIRSARAPPQMMPLEEVEPTSPPLDQEPYRDNPNDSPADIDGLSSEHARAAGIRQNNRDARRAQSPNSDDSDFTDEDSDPFELRVNRTSEIPPMLAPIESVGDIDMPSRVGSRVSSKPSRNKSAASVAPEIPRKSSRRGGSRDGISFLEPGRLSAVTASPPGSPGRTPTASMQPQPYLTGNTLNVQMPFSSSNPSPSPERISGGASAASSIFPAGETSAEHGHKGDLRSEERPMSTGYVQHYLAGEGIRPGLQPALGAEAELVDLSTTRSRSTGRNSDRT